MLNHKDKLIDIFQKIQQAGNILMVGHKAPDEDCLGAICALSCYFDSIGKNHTIFNFDKIFENFNYLSGIDKITNDINEIQTKVFDLILVLDTGSLEYSGIKDYLEKAQKEVFIINIDHHKSNSNFGHINLVESNASSVSEIIYNLFQYNKVYITKEMANCLLTGIIADSDNFSNAATTVESMNAASYLLTHGGRLPKIVKNTYKNKSLTSLKLWGIVLSRLKQNKKYNVAYTYVTHDDLQKYNVAKETIEGIANFLNKLAGHKVIFFIKEKDPGEITVSMRTNNNLIDVSKLAKMIGGGGHRKAAGFSVKGKIVGNGGKVMIV
ncbi:MAG: bifunctional oligoribonuclease/PAP phosphatase NrnA [bacterium]